MIRFSLMNRQDGKMGLFSPEAKQTIVIDKESFKQLFTKISLDQPEIMPKENLEGLGLSFGVMSLTTWNKVISLAKKLGATIII